MKSERVAPQEIIKVSEDASFLKSEVLARVNSHPDLPIIRNAVTFAEMAHFGQKRAHGGPAIVHLYRVALNFMDHHLYNTDSVVSALLHDSVEDNKAISLAFVEKQFGVEVSQNVGLLSRDIEGIAKPSEEYHLGLLSAPDDVKRIKVYDRIDNLWSWTRQVGEDDRRARKIDETIATISPLAEFDPILDEQLESALQAVRQSFTRNQNN